MSVELVLDQYSFPETGIVDINLNVSFVIHVSAEQARHQVSKWLFQEVSYMFVADLPTLSIGEHIVWRVPVILTASHLGKVGNIGYIDVDVESSDMDTGVATKERLLNKARCLAETMPPYASPNKSNSTVSAPVPEANRFQPQGDPQQILQNFKIAAVH